MENREEAEIKLDHLHQCGWYYGGMTSVEAEAILTQCPTGTFLIRDGEDSVAKEKFPYVLSFNHCGAPYHVRFEKSVQGNYRLKMDQDLRIVLDDDCRVIWSVTGLCFTACVKGRRDTSVTLQNESPVGLVDMHTMIIPSAPPVQPMYILNGKSHMSIILKHPYIRQMRTVERSVEPLFALPCLLCLSFAVCVLFL